MESSMQDAEIIGRIRAGDTSAAQLLLQKYGRVLLVVGLRNGLSEADAEEVVNDVFLAALTMIRAGKLGPNMGPWLQKVMKNRAIDRYRHDRPARENEGIPFDNLGNAVYEQDSEPRKSRDLFLLEQAMEGFAQEEKKPIGPSSKVSDVDILKWIAHGATNEELAEYLNTNVNAAKQRRFRALRRLKQKIERLRESSDNAVVTRVGPAL
jgi:RNA polymerase sigma factor (sigma-70 family)